MTEEEIIQTLIDYLNQHLSGTRGYIGHSPYKSDIFELFADAYRKGYLDVSSNPRLTADGLRQVLSARWSAPDDDQGQRLMEGVLQMWREWQYAWDHHGN